MAKLLLLWALRVGTQASSAVRAIRPGFITLHEDPSRAGWTGQCV